MKSGYHKFYGIAQKISTVKNHFDESEEVDITYIKFDDGYVILKEDPEDGYRSHGELNFSKECPEGLTFNLDHHPKVIYRDFDTNRLSEDEPRYGGTWDGMLLRVAENEDIFGWFGTDNSDDWYPCYQCELNISFMNELLYKNTPLYKILNQGEKDV